MAPLSVPGRAEAEADQDVASYQAQVVRDGIPVRSNGLFPENDEYLGLLASQYSPGTKGLLMPTTDGGVEFASVESGWACGESAISHGMDLRWFIKPGMEEQTLLAAVRFSDYACVGRGIGRGVV